MRARLGLKLIEHTNNNNIVNDHHQHQHRTRNYILIRGSWWPHGGVPVDVDSRLSRLPF